MHCFRPPKVLAALEFKVGHVRNTIVQGHLEACRNDPLSVVLVNTPAPLDLLKQHKGAVRSLVRQVYVLSLLSLTTLLAALGFSTDVRNAFLPLNNPGKSLYKCNCNKRSNIFCSTCSIPLSVIGLKFHLLMCRATQIGCVSNWRWTPCGLNCSCNTTGPFGSR